MSKNWDEYFIHMLNAVASKSKDTSTKVGAIIVGEHKNILSTGFNGFPRKIQDKKHSITHNPYSLPRHHLKKLQEDIQKRFERPRSFC